MDGESISADFRPDEQGVSTDEVKSKTALAGFVLGVCSMLFTWLLGVLPLLAIIFSGIGLNATGQVQKKKGRWMAWTGLVLGIIYTLMALFYYPNY